MKRPLRHRAPVRRDRGITLIETLMAVAIFGVVLVASLDSLVSFTGAEQDQARVVQARNDVRLVLRELGRDVQYAGTIAAPPSGGAASTTLDLEVNGQAVRWRSAGSQLLRETLSGAGGTVTGTRTVLTDLVVPAGAALFAYFDPSGASVDPTGIDPAVLSACASRVRVSVGTQPAQLGTPATQVADFALRSRDTASGCPQAASSSPAGSGWSLAVTGSAPLGWWRLGEVSGATAANSGTGAGLDGTWETASGLQRSSSGITPTDGAALLDGSGSPAPFVSLGAPAGLSGPKTGWSFGAWVRPAVRQPGPTGTVIRKGSGPAAFRLSISAEGAASARVGLVGGGRVGVTSPDGSVRPSEWAFVVAAYDGTTMRLYVNGAPAASITRAGSVDLGGAEAVTIGASPDRSTRFVGTIDEVAVWDRALSAREVSDLMRAAG